jgi:hypothetical protein
LWNYETPDGRSIRKAFDFLTPFALRDKQWTYQQLGGWSADDFTPLARQAALKFPDRRYAELAAKLAQPKPSDRAILLLPISAKERPEGS